VSTTEQDSLAAVLGRLPSGLFVLVAGDDHGRQTGMLASWVQQASFAPPTVTVAIKRGRYLHDWLRKRPDIVLNILGESQKKLLGHFGKGFEPDEPAFEGLDVATAANGLTVLTHSLGWLEGRVTGTLDGGDHIIYLVELTGGERGTAFDTEKPWVHLRKSGFGY
jgi:3-hydroxy-9,10-secoandrosta-1,3,5(10)-triene-9,17-dione monooxygenase reductase component